jgi:hypothetical protein
MDTTISLFLLGVLVGQWVTVWGLVKYLTQTAQIKKK